MTWPFRSLELRQTAGGRTARPVTWLELFFDLIFVAAVAQVAEPLRHDYTVEGVVRFSVLFVLIWWAWIGNSVFATRFAGNDGLHRSLVLLQMFAVAAMAANASSALDSRDSAGFAAAYAVLRVLLVFQYARARSIPCARGLGTWYCVGHGIAAIVWLVSAFVPPPSRFVLWSAALVVDLGTPWLAVRHNVAVPPDAAHLPERFGLFTLILLGESIVAVSHGMSSQEGWSPIPAAAAFFGIGIAFAIWWWYFDGIHAADERPVRTARDGRRIQVWSYAHLPLYIGIATIAAGVERAVRAEAGHHGVDTVMLGAAVAVVMVALIVIGASGSGDATHRRPVGPHLTVAALTLAAAAVVPPSSAVALFAGLCGLQVWLSVAVAPATSWPFASSAQPSRSLGTPLAEVSFERPELQ